MGLFDDEKSEEASLPPCTACGTPTPSEMWGSRTCFACAVEIDADEGYEALQTKLRAIKPSEDAAPAYAELRLFMRAWAEKKAKAA